MKKIAIIYSSTTGSTETLACNIKLGIEMYSKEEGSGIEAEAYNVLSFKTYDDITKILNNCDAMIFGSQVHLGGLSKEFVSFIEHTGLIWKNSLWRSKLAAGFTNSASMYGDKGGALSQLMTFAAQHGMIWISLGIKDSTQSSNSVGSATGINRVGSSIGLMAQSGHTGPSEGDISTAIQFGKRISEIVVKYNS